MIEAAAPMAALLCSLCADPNVERAWHHAHEPDGLHWHHCIDPGDGLPSPCGATHLFTRLYRVLADGRAQRPRLVDEVVDRQVGPRRP